MNKAKGKRYDEEVKKGLLQLYYRGVSKASICKNFDVSSSSINSWIREYPELAEEAGRTDNERELQQKIIKLERENAILRQTVSILSETQDKG